MKLLKPNWVSHDGSPIFSVDVHPDGSRFATGGQGSDSGVVIIWNMAPIRSESDELNPDIPKVLCEMTNHLGCVNCVRWSVDGKWLASGGDDALVMIWQIKFQGVERSSFGTNYEQWRCVHMLRGHNGDVLDLSWSPDQKYIASCSVDNSIIIWNARNLPQKFSVISGHQGLVKGITWDPVGKYVASQSDDRTVRIWRTSDWKEERKISDPFKHCGGTTHVLRLSWSPDGKYLVSAHALNNDGPTAQIIQRGDWKTGMDFVGHRKAIEVVSFNPHLFARNGSCSDNHGCIAIGSRDRSLSIWLTSLKRPLVVTHDLFKDSILDISWSRDGYELMVCSTDGSIAYICLSEKELGSRLSKQAIEDLFVSTYGCERAGSRSSNISMDIIEDPDILKLHTDKTTTPEKNLTAQNSTPQKYEDATSSAQLNRSIQLTSDSAKLPTVTQQKESRTKDGRRRITPVMLDSQTSSLSGTPLPFSSFSPANKDSKEQSSVVTTSQPKPPSEVVLPIGSPPPKPISFEPLSPSKKGTSEKLAKVGEKRQPEPETLLPKAKKVKRAKANETSAQSSTPQKTINVHTMAKQATLPVPNIETNVTVQIIARAGESAPVTVELDNSSARCIVTCRKGESVVWSTTLPSKGLLVSGNQFITCVVCKDKSMSLYSSESGRSLLARLMLPCQPHALKTNMHTVMVVGGDAHVNVWDVLNMKSVIQQVSFGHLLEGGKRLESSTVTASGIPVLNLTSVSYMFHKDMSIWMEVCNSDEHTEIQSPQFSLTKESTPLEHIQKSTSARSDSVTQMLLGLKNTSNRSSTLAFLESQMSRSLCLQSPLEYQHWTKAYVRYLVTENLESRLREFCMTFAGPGDHGSMILGFPRQVFLKDFLAVVAGSGKLQRLYCELRDSLDISREA